MPKTFKTSNTRRWPEGAIVYQIYPRSFFDSNADGIGDLAGIIGKLDYVQSLGVNAIWLSPFYPSPMADFGYDVADYCNVDPMFGNLEDIKQLIKSAHARGIKLMVDLVPNHSSDEHPWFSASRKSRDGGKYSDWYIWKDAKSSNKKAKPAPPNNWVEVLTGGSAWQWEPERQQFYLHSFDVKQPDLNWSNPAVREAIKDVMRFWLDLGIDGFRVDAVQFMGKDPTYSDEKRNPHYIAGRDGRYGKLLHTKNHGWPAMFGYLAELAGVLKEPRYVGRDLFMVTEAYPDSSDRIAEYLSYYQGMDPAVAAPFIFEGLDYLPWEAAPWRHFLTDFHNALDDFSPLCVASYALGNHDKHRIVSRLGVAPARSAAVLLLTLPGMAFVYNGDELGMKNGHIPQDCIQDPGAEGGWGRDPERTPLHWTSGHNAGFSAAARPWLPLAENYETHNVETESQDPASFLSLYRQLGKLRNGSPALRYGELELLDTNHKGVLGYRRRQGNQAFVTLVNFADQPAELALRLSGNVMISSDPRSRLAGQAYRQPQLRPHEAIVVEESAGH